MIPVRCKHMMGRTVRIETGPDEAGAPPTRANLSTGRRTKLPGDAWLKGAAIGRAVALHDRRRRI